MQLVLGVVAGRCNTWTMDCWTGPMDWTVGPSRSCTVFSLVPRPIVTGQGMRVLRMRKRFCGTWKEVKMDKWDSSSSGEGDSSMQQQLLAPLVHLFKIMGISAADSGIASVHQSVLQLM